MALRAGRAQGVLNAFNEDEFGNPIASVNNTGFGTNTNNWGNRSLTLGVKYRF